MDNWAPDSWAPGQSGPGQLGQSWAPGPDCPGPNCLGPSLPSTKSSFSILMMIRKMKSRDPGVMYYGLNVGLET